MNARALVTVMLEAEDIDWSPDPDDPDSSTKAPPVLGDRYCIGWLGANDDTWYWTRPFSTPHAALEWAYQSSVWNKAKHVELASFETSERWRMDGDYEVVDAEGSLGTPRPIFSVDEPNGPKRYWPPPDKSELRQFE